MKSDLSKKHPLPDLIGATVVAAEHGLDSNGYDYLRIAFDNGIVVSRTEKKVK
jgi:hypothetical protein